jgi:hypothetical protein
LKNRSAKIDQRKGTLRGFSDDWATSEILRKFVDVANVLKGKRKGENSKLKQSEAEGSGLRKKVKMGWPLTRVA